MRLLLLLACAAHPEAPPDCAQMCGSAEALYGTCLSDWGLGWDAAGYADGQDFVASCETWVWELAVLEEEAVRQGDAGAAGRTQDFCQERFDQLSADEATCAAYTEQEWGGLL